jgi:RNA polymerase sigma factor (sigma-70 family)
MGSIDTNWKRFLEKGDEPSFSFIYNTHADDLYAYGISLGFQKETCKDAIQDTFYKLYISKENLKHVENVTAYIFKSFKYRLFDITKKIGKRINIDNTSESFIIDVTILDDIIDQETEEMVKKKVTSLLSCLTTNQREVVYLKYMIGLQHKEIAEILGIEEDSSRKLLYRAIEKLRKKEKTENQLFLLLALFPRLF